MYLRSRIWFIVYLFIGWSIIQTIAQAEDVKEPGV